MTYINRYSHQIQIWVEEFSMKNEGAKGGLRKKQNSSKKLNVLGIR